MGTHCHLESGLVFFVGRCENCGGMVREVNATRITNLRELRSTNLSYVCDLVGGLKELDELPPEVTIIDGDTGECGCEACA